MKAEVDQDGCISCGLCVSVCPSVFRFNDDDKAEAYDDVTEENKAEAKEAEEGCPVSVISVKE